MQVKQILSNEAPFTPITLQITINSASELSWLWDRVCNKMMLAENAAQREWAGRHLPMKDHSVDALEQALNDLVMQQIDKDAGTRGDKTIEYHSNVVCGD
jgi:hypothetical protein